MLKKAFCNSLMLFIALFVGTGATVNVSAKAVKTKGFRAVKIIKDTRYAKSTYKKSHAKKGMTLYTNRYLANHLTSKKTGTFYSTESVRVQKSTGKLATYRYVMNASKTVKGWAWSGDLTGNQGKVKSVSNQTVIVPTTNIRVARKTEITFIEKTSSDPLAKKVPEIGGSDVVTIGIISDAISNSGFGGIKHMATDRNKLNKWGRILKNHPAAWDAYGMKNTKNTEYSRNYMHAQIHSIVYRDYLDTFHDYTRCAS